MTRPSDFILNSDYLSIAQVSRSEFTAHFAAGTLAKDAFIELTRDFSVPAQSGAVDRIVIKHGAEDFMLGACKYITPLYANNGDDHITGFVTVFRTDSSTVRAQLMLENQGTAAANYPAMDFTIKISSFKPPNVF